MGFMPRIVFETLRYEIMQTFSMIPHIIQGLLTPACFSIRLSALCYS